MVQWVKNLPAVTPVTAEARVQSLAQWVKGSKLSQPQLGFNPWPVNFHLPWVWLKKKKKKKKKNPECFPKTKNKQTNKQQQKKKTRK